MNSDCLLVVHSHWRVGGVRAVIERSLPAILAESTWGRAVLLSGERAPTSWMEALKISCSSHRLQEEVTPALGYVSEMKRPPDVAVLQNFWKQVLKKFRPAAIWWHNPGLARNVPAVESLLRANENYQIPLLFHHHDLWCDHRWNRWPEMQACGYKSLSDIAQVLFAERPDVTHITINSRDHGLFHSHLGQNAKKLGNAFDPPKAVNEKEKQGARSWLRDVCEADQKTHLWLAPARLLRRKNLLESLLLLHRFQPGSILVTSNQVPSRDELPYKDALEQVAANPASGLRLINLNSQGAPRMAALHAAADVLIQSSLQEGFGLLFLEAAWAEKPLICRKLSNVWPDLVKRELHFPLAYDETPVDLPAPDRTKEQQIQRKLMTDWSNSLPDPWRCLAEVDPLTSLFNGGPLPFSKLTLQTQLQVLEREITSPSAVKEFSFARSDWPAKAAEFSAKAYAQNFLRIIGTGSPLQRGYGENSVLLQDSIARDALSAQNLFPLLIEKISRSYDLGAAHKYHDTSK